MLNYKTLQCINVFDEPVEKALVMAKRIAVYVTMNLFCKIEQT